MKKTNETEKYMMTLPEGCFCGNCTDCVYAGDWNGDRVYCWCEKGWTKGYNRPSDRNGCIWYERR